MHDHDDPKRCKVCRKILLELEELELLTREAQPSINAAVLQHIGTAEA